MMGAIFAQHVPLIRDYPSAPPPPPAPPAPPTPPNPPQAEPIAFSVVTRASLFGIVGAATGTITLATVTCADAAMTIDVSDAVPGLTFSYAAKVLTVAGTPTGPTMVYRVVVSYVSSDGNSTIRGSSSHEITIVDATEVLTIGNMAGASGRVGIPLTATLASPTTNYSVSVTAAGSNLVPGLSPTLAWTRGASSGSGVLTLAGTPTDAGTYSLTVNFRSDEIALGTSTHAVVIAAAYEAPAPAPAPVAAPTPPAPSPPPAPTPEPAPGMGPDSFLSNVKVLMRFDAATGIAYDHRGNTFTNSGATSTTGAVDEAANFEPGQSIYGSISTIDTATTEITVDAMVSADPLSEVFAENDSRIAWTDYRVSSESPTQTVTLSRTPIDGTITVTWAATDSYEGGSGTGAVVSGKTVLLSGLLAGQTYQMTINYSTYESESGVADTRFSPIVSLVNPGNQLAWALGIFSYNEAGLRRWTTAFVMPLSTHSASLGTRLKTLFAYGGLWQKAPATGTRFVQMAGGSMREASLLKLAAFVDGRAAAMDALYDRCALPATGIPTVTGAVLRIGGTCPLPPRNASGLTSIDKIIPFVGAIDEVRVTSANRYITAGYINSTQTLTVSAASRVIPWPNY